jgi:hypothetical protein
MAEMMDIDGALEPAAGYEAALEATSQGRVLLTCRRQVWFIQQTVRCTVPLVIPAALSFVFDVALITLHALCLVLQRRWGLDLLKMLLSC